MESSKEWVSFIRSRKIGKLEEPSIVVCFHSGKVKEFYLWIIIVFVSILNSLFWIASLDYVYIVSWIWDWCTPTYANCKHKKQFDIVFFRIHTVRLELIIFAKFVESFASAKNRDADFCFHEWKNKRWKMVGLCVAMCIE
jgi:hypothetical protein